MMQRMRCQGAGLWESDWRDRYASLLSLNQLLLQNHKMIEFKNSEKGLKEHATQQNPIYFIYL